MTTTDRVLCDPAGVVQANAHPQLHASHLALADRLRGCSRGMRGQLVHPDAPTHDEDDYLRGYMRALDDIAAHLRHGDCLPGGLFGESPLAASA